MYSHYEIKELCDVTTIFDKIHVDKINYKLLKWGD